MTAWSRLVSGLVDVFDGTAASLDAPVGVAILLVALAARLALVPVTLPLTLRSRTWQATYRRLKPALAETRRIHRDDPGRSIREVDQRYAEAGIRVVDWAGLASALIQIPVLVALFQAVLERSEGTALGDPSWALGLAAGAVAAASVAVSETSPRPLQLALFGALPLVFVLWLGAGVGWYLLGVSAAATVQSWFIRRRDAPDDPPADDQPATGEGRPPGG